MELSRFVITYRDAVPGEHVLYDVVTDRYVGVDDTLLGAIEAWRGAPPGTASEREAHASLAELGFLVEGRAADDARLAAFWNRVQEGMPGTMYVTWLTTLACNLACTYCFQKDHPATGHMSAETEAATVDFVLRQVDEAGTAHLLVHFIGGEPLTRKDLVRRSARRLADAMAARGGTFAWEITTNGVGLEPTFVNELLALGKGTVKLTLDGDQETHDAARVYRNGKGSFEEVFGALTSVAKGCPGLTLRLGGNFRPGQASSYERLLQRMEAAGLRGLVDEIRFKPVADDHSPQGGCGGCADVRAEAETLVQIGRAVERSGLGRKSLGAVDSAALCELHWKNAWVVDPAGLLYKCLDVAGRAEVSIGNVRDGQRREDPLTRDRPWESHPPCATCAFLPVCGGGCIGGRYLQTGRAGEVLCRLEEFEISFREEVLSRYLAEFHCSDDEKEAA